MSQQIKLCFIKSEFFEHKYLVKVLDVDNIDKQTRRSHLCLTIKYHNKYVLVPLRNNLGTALKPYGKIGFSTPTNKRKDAGLDYRYIMIVENETYIEWQTEIKIPFSQYRILLNNYDLIEREVIQYIEKFKKVALKDRVQKEPLFRESSLINFLGEL